MISWSISMKLGGWAGIQTCDSWIRCQTLYWLHYWAPHESGKFISACIIWRDFYVIKYNATSQLLSCWTRIYPAFASSVDPDQLTSEEANWSGSALFAIKYVNYSNNPDQVIWLAENLKWAWYLNLFSRTRLNTSHLPMTEFSNSLI